jgi:integrase
MTPKLKNAVLLSLDCGLRKGELLRLTWLDVDVNRKVVTVRVSKTKKPRIVPLTARGIGALESQKTRRGPGEPLPTELVFAEIAVIGDRGEAALRGGAEKDWKACRAKAGFPTLRWHDLRHVFAVTAARAGVPLGDLMKILGHSSLIMSMRYAHHAPANSGDLARTRLEEFLGREGGIGEGTPLEAEEPLRTNKAPTKAPRRPRQTALSV